MALPMINNGCHSPSSSSSLRDMLKAYISCFRTNQHNQILEPDSDDGRRKINHARPEIRDRCMVLIGMRGKNRRRHGWADFSYDPASYSLNFEDENSRDDELPLNNFMARLPATPEKFPVEDWAESRGVVSRVTAPRREVVAWS